MSVDVYCVTCTINQKRYYGIASTGWQRRWRQHIQEAARGSSDALHRAIRKHGAQNFSVELVYEAVNWLEAGKVERGLIAQHGTYRRGGYNVTVGGGGTLGFKHTKRSKELLRRAGTGRRHTEESKLKMSAAQALRTQTTETREKLSELQRGKIIPLETRKKMREGQQRRRARQRFY